MIKKVVKKIAGKVTRKKKGNMVKIKDLMGKPTSFVRLKEAMMPAFEEYKTFGRSSAIPLKGTDIAITRITDHAYCYINFLDLNDPQGVTHMAHLPYGTELTLIEGDELVAVQEKFDKLIINRMHAHLPHTFYMGSDPEIFVEDKKGNIVPAFDFLGSKTKPNIVKTNGHNQNLYWDGFQAEFTTVAGTCLDGQTAQVAFAMQELARLAKTHNAEAMLSNKTVMNIPAKLLASAKDEHVQFGCAPSLNIYGMKGTVSDGRDTPFRPAGGHIHFGIGKKTDAQIEQIVKALDAILAVSCVSLFEKYDDIRRRKLYGLAGEYRLPPHGIEYRVLSNAWIFHPLLMNIVNDFARKVLVFGEAGYLKYWEGTEEETIRIVNECDVEAARKVMKRNKSLLLQIFQAAARGNQQDGEFLYGIFLKGCDSVIKNMEDVAGNWKGSGTDKNWRSCKSSLYNGKAV